MRHAGKRSVDVDDVNFTVVAYSTPEAYLAALNTHLGESFDTWTTNPLIGPTQTMLQNDATTSSSKSFAVYEAPRIDIWLVLFATSPAELGAKQNVEVILTKLHGEAAVLGSPKELSKLSTDRLSAGLDELATRLRALLPSSTSTPGGTIRPANVHSPNTNVPSLVGPSRLASLFASKLQALSPSPALSCNTSTKYRYTHLPVSLIPPEIKLMEGCEIRLATMDDKLATLANLFRDHQIACSGPSNEFVSFEGSLKAVEKNVLNKTCWIYK